MIDIHCHILYGMDDGASTVTETIEMAKNAVNDGIKKIIATPHHRNGKFINSKDNIIRNVNELNELLTEEQINIEIIPGQEIRIYGEIIPDYEKGDILTIDNAHRYLLIELPFDHVPRYTGRLFFDLQLQGLIPVIVHPERNQEILENPDILYSLINDGALSQITAASLLTKRKKIKQFCLQLIQHNLTHFVSSDAHNTSSRPFQLSEAYGIIEKQLGIDTRFLLSENAELLAGNQVIYKEVPDKVGRRSLFNLLRNRF